MPPEDINKLFSKLITEKSTRKVFLNPETRSKTLETIKIDEGLSFDPEEEIKLLSIKAKTLPEFAQHYLESNQSLVNKEKESLS